MDIGEALQSAGFETVLCADLRSAREAFAREGAVLVVLDVLLPDGDGLDFLKELRSSPATAQIPVLLLSTEAEVKFLFPRVGAGAEEYIGKPYDLGQVVARARTLTQADASGGVASGGETSPTLLGPKRLLAVDDSITYLQELGSQLRQEGYDVVLATSGEEALELLAAQPVDCILLDLIMPGLSGQDTCRRIKLRAEWRYVPLIMLTARDDRDAMIEGFNAGADDYVAKSADFDVLKTRLRAQIRHKHFEDENRRIREELVRKETEAIAHKQVEAEQKKLAQGLRDQHFYTRSLIESTIDALVITDPRGIISDANKQMAALTGYTRDELIGAPFKNYFTDPERAESVIKLVLSQKKVNDYELTAHARDGKKTEVSYNATTLYDRDRTLQGVFAAARDVTERNRANRHSAQALRELNDVKAAIDEHAIVAITDPKGKIAYVNDKFCAISKYSREELLGKDHRIINSGFHPKEFIRSIWQTISDGRVWKGEIKNKAKDGTFYWVDTTIVPYLGEDGEPLQYIAIRADITERKRNEQALQETIVELESAKSAAEIANLAKSDFLSSMSHELRSPVNAILGFAQLIESASPLPTDSQKESIAQILLAGGHLLKLIDLAVIESGKVSISPESVALHEVMCRVGPDRA
jgi:PAS domain S-box-containing protein